jgi:glycosyltransferase involved in cell wall biosynthesis
VPEVPDLACVVIALRAQPELADAVRSVLEQDEPVEVVVVNSGGGDAAALLAGLDVRVVELPERVFPGAARNAGVAATSARWVAFLAADCLAEPGWAAARLRAHRAGADAVASAMVCRSGAGMAERASLLLLHHRRLPDTPPGFRLLYSLSYERGVLERYGPFREDLRIGEDTVLNRSFGPEVRVVWDPGVRTAHRFPRTLPALLADQYARGRRRASMGDLPPWRLAGRAVLDVGRCSRQALLTRDRAERRRLAAALALVPLGAAAYAAGALSVASPSAAMAATPQVGPAPGART